MPERAVRACPTRSCPRRGRLVDTGLPTPRSSSDAAALCLSCAAHLAKHLAALPALYTELERDLAPSRATVGEVRGTGVPGIRLNEDVLAARADIRLVLASWADLVVEGCGAPPPARTVPAMVRFLTRQLPWLATHPAAGDAADEIAGLVRSAVTAGLPSLWRRIQLGDCIVPDCSGRLVALVRDRDAALPSAIACDSCAEHTWPPRLWHTLQARRATPGAAGLTAEDIAAAWRIPRGTVYWLANAHTWRRQRHGRRVFYSVADVVTTLTAGQPGTGHHDPEETVPRPQ